MPNKDQGGFKLYRKAAALNAGSSSSLARRNLENVMGKYGLIDSGATHHLKNWKKRSEADKRSVGRGPARQPSTDSLGGDPVRDSAHSSLGYEFVWNHRGSRLHHPTKTSAQVFYKKFMSRGTRVRCIEADRRAGE